jgi:hypothetical protein
MGGDIFGVKSESKVQTRKRESKIQKRSIRIKITYKT